MERTSSCPERLANHFGNPSEAARHLKLDRQSVYTWVDKGYIPPMHALEVERITKGEITIREILEEANAVNPFVSKSRRIP